MNNAVLTENTTKVELPSLPKISDPRVAVLICLCAYVTVGITFLGFNRAFSQIALMVFVAVIFEMGMTRLLYRKWIFPISAIITAVGLGILANAAHGLWLPLIPVIISLASKYVVTFDNRHIFNPSLFGLVAAIMISDGMISPSPAYQWGGDSYIAIIAFIITLAVLLFVARIGRTTLVLAFIGLYTLTLLIRAYYLQWHVPAETIILGTLATPAFYLFTFFMITDPATSPKGWRQQLWMAFFICAVDLYLHTVESLSTLFKAGFLYFSMVWLYRHGGAAVANPAMVITRFRGAWRRILLVTGVTLLSVLALLPTQTNSAIVDLGFGFKEISAEAAGIVSEPSDVANHVDERIKHIAKWLLSVGDAVAFADVNNDGLSDMFLTYPLKNAEARAALYINRGNMTFSRQPIPQLTEWFSDYKKYGLPSGALWLDIDNDNDQDLLMLISFGYSRLLINQFSETGKVTFVDGSAAWGLNEYTTSITANTFDVNRDGMLDIIIGNASSTHLTGYESAEPFNIFALPAAEYDGDRRMLNFMHRSWGNANNGGENYLYVNRGKQLARLSNDVTGMTNTRWTLDIATGDLNGDGWTDLYMANDFGRDQLYLNNGDETFTEIKGSLAGDMGKDTYKGMNATMADMDGNGLLDIYVSNVHAPLQAEGSLLWLNDGTVDANGHQAFTDMAMAKNMLNENRFGWGAAAGDLDLDGRLDLIQANGMVDDSFDELYEGCPDYWYWNDKIALTGPDIHGYADRWADIRGRCIFPNQLNRVYLNRGRYFVDVADRVGWTKGGESRGMAMVDLDNDGDLDVVVTGQFDPVSIYENTVTDKRWLGIELSGNGVSCSRDAIGSKLNLHIETADGVVKMIREQHASNGFHAQGDHRHLFGLKSLVAEEVGLDITWCDGQEESINIAELNRYHHIKQD